MRLPTCSPYLRKLRPAGVGTDPQHAEELGLKLRFPVLRFGALSISESLYPVNKYFPSTSSGWDFMDD